MKRPTIKGPTIKGLAGRALAGARRVDVTRWREMSRPPAAFAVVAVLAGGVTTAELTHRDTRPAVRPLPRTLAPVVGSIAVCPDALTTTKSVSTRVTAGVGGAGDTRVSAAKLAPGAAAEMLVEDGSRVGQFGAGGDAAAIASEGTAVVTTATGPEAGGLAAEQVTRAESGAQFGLASVRCEPAVADSWYVGAATTISDKSELFLVNPYDEVATVDVSIYTSKGVRDIPGTKGVSVGARSRVVKALADWAPDEQWLAVRVEVRAGRVSPAIRRSRSVRSVASGVEWVPRSIPGEQVALGALPGGEGERTLVLVNPGIDTLIAHVTVSRQDGQFTPIDLAEVEIEGQQLVALPVSDDLDNLSAMMHVVTDGPPVIAGGFAAYLPATPGAASDFVLAGSAPALSGPALLTDNRVGPTVDTSLMFSAPDGDAEVTLTLLTSDGSAGRTSLVPVRQGDLVVVAVSRAFGRGDPQPILVTTSANSAAVHATRVVVEKTKQGTLMTTFAVAPQPLGGVPVPRVAHDPAGWLLTRD
ncbi:MAG: DUF5719 family protein [Mycobacteriales bacterium]